MRAVVTRVRQASVEIDGQIHSRIGAGLLVLLGVGSGDTREDAEYLAGKVCAVRIFEDENGKMNLSPAQAGAELLVISNFTLYGNCRSRRPDFLQAARPEPAQALYELFMSECERQGFSVKRGVFGADMQVFSQNDGPITLIMDTDALRRKQE